MYRKEKNKKDILFILENLRPEDAHEVIIQRGKNFKNELVKEFIEKDDYFVLGCTKEENTPVVIGGCTHVGNNIGCIWMLSTPEVLNHQICLLKNLKHEIEFFDKKYWLTFNILYKENNAAKRWLKHFGYRFPASEKNKTIYDRNIIKTVNVPENFELFYRLRNTRGLS